MIIVVTDAELVGDGVLLAHTMSTSIHIHAVAAAAAAAAAAGASASPLRRPVPQNCTSLIAFLQEETYGNALVQPTCEPACAQSFASVSNHTLSTVGATQPAAFRNPPAPSPRHTMGLARAPGSSVRPETPSHLPPCTPPITTIHPSLACLQLTTACQNGAIMAFAADKSQFGQMGSIFIKDCLNEVAALTAADLLLAAQPSATAGTGAPALSPASGPAPAPAPGPW